MSLSSCLVIKKIYKRQRKGGTAGESEEDANNKHEREGDAKGAEEGCRSLCA